MALLAYGLRRLRVYGVLVVALLLGVSVACGLFASAPLYQQAVAGLGLRHALQTAPHHMVNLQILSPVPLDEPAWTTVTEELGSLVAGRVDVTYTDPLYRRGQRGCVHLYAFADLASHIRLLTGRWPRSVPSFFPAVGGWPREAGFGPIVQPFHPSAVDLEALVSADVAREMDVGVGSRLRVGPSSQRTVVIRIVGTFEALDPEEAYWMAQSRPLKGAWVEAGLETRYDGALLVNPEDFRARVVPLKAHTTYAWYVLLHQGQIYAENMTDVRRGLIHVAEALQAYDISVVTGLVNVIARFEAAMAQMEAPLALVLLAPLTLVLYYLITTAGLALEQQAGEWATLSSRGTSGGQLIRLHLATVVPLCLVGALVGPALAQVGLALMCRVGPLAALAVDPRLPVPTPRSAWTYSAAAALLAGLPLLLPALPVAGRGMVAFRQARARPPQRPVWTRFYLDLVLLAAGTGLSWRAAYYGGLRTATLAGERGVDPLHLAAPLLLLTGGALLWLRLFPLGVRLAAALAARQRGLTLPLALWGVGRDPGYYAHLVLLLLGAVALGAFTVVVEATREQSSWELARQRTGGAVRVTLTRGAAPWATDWEGLPGVTAATVLFRGASDRPHAPKRAVVLGVEPATLPAVAPVSSERLSPLAAAERLGGQPLPPETATLAVWMFQEPGPTQVKQFLQAHLAGPLGARRILSLTPLEARAGRWVLWRSPLPPAERGPWRLTALTLDSHYPDRGFHRSVVYLDDLWAVYRDGRQALVLEDFEAGMAHWSPAQEGDPWGSPELTWSAERAHEGQNSLRVEHTAHYAHSLRWGVWLKRPVSVAIPALVGYSWAEAQGLKAGDTFLLPVGELDRGPYRRLPFVVASVVEDLPTLEEARGSFVVAPRDALLAALNLEAEPLLLPNEVWLDTAGGAPDPALLAALARPELQVKEVVTAAELRDVYRREPLANAMAGALFVGFWAALGLGLAGFGFYLALTARRRAVSFAVLRALGWSGGNLARLLALEGVILVLPALVVGMGLGLGLARQLQPFLPLPGRAKPVLPWPILGGLILALAVGFGVLLIGLAAWLRVQTVTEPLRLGEE